ncbi:MAG: biotin--[acetyl-CoA-carboxylase] ligase [Candidatus Actinomarina sp.]|jgi:BirA family biotin operon repressor/biotin-[acetyl-CoA-carboxylase] ligase|tara:strand:- start:3739 stop:4395 length:657 start_codon:yes stop_codon:yes gene_type:complete
MKSIFFDEIANTQDYAINEFKEETLLIVSKAQTAGRGTNKNKWENADQSLAASLVFNKKIVNFKKTLIPLLAGYSFVCLNQIEDLKLKWPNDITLNEDKVGGVLVEENNDLICIGLGVNYFWSNPVMPGAGGLYKEKQDDNGIFLDAEKWAKKVMDYITKKDFNLENYKLKLTTLGKLVEYPDGRGWAKDINDDGSLKIETPSGELLNLTSPLISEII